MLTAIREIFIPKKDYAGRSIDAVINGLAMQTKSSFHDWSYLHDLSAYENTITGMRVYPHETSLKSH